MSVGNILLIIILIILLVFFFSILIPVLIILAIAYGIYYIIKAITRNNNNTYYEYFKTPYYPPTSTTVSIYQGNTDQYSGDNWYEPVQQYFDVSANGYSDRANDGYELPSHVSEYCFHKKIAETGDFGTAVASCTLASPLATSY